MTIASVLGHGDSLALLCWRLNHATTNSIHAKACCPPAHSWFQSFRHGNVHVVDSLRSGARIAIYKIHEDRYSFSRRVRPCRGEGLSDGCIVEIIHWAPLTIRAIMGHSSCSKNCTCDKFSSAAISLMKVGDQALLAVPCGPSPFLSAYRALYVYGSDAH